MAATDRTDTPWLGSVLAAALALPGLAPQAQAETPPEQAELSLQQLSYRDWQPGLDRIHVQAPALGLVLPVGSRWAVEGSLVNDSVSGASPRYHTAVSGASRLDENRWAGDLKLTHYGERESWALGTAASDEHDYNSHTVSGEYRWSTEDNNRTWNLGLSLTRDAIGSSNDPSLDQHRRTWQWSTGVTQAVSPTDLVQLSLGGSHGTGYFNDPYKFPDNRPRLRNQFTLSARWNHHIESLGATLRTAWRSYGDTFGVRAQTVEAAWVQPIASGWQLTPSLRYTTQRAARFYDDPVYSSSLGVPFPPGYDANGYHSPDQRLSGFGALTAGLRLEVALAADWDANVSYDRYEQRSGWRLGGDGSPGLAPFSAQWWQFGLRHRF